MNVVLYQNCYTPEKAQDSNLMPGFEKWIPETNSNPELREYPKLRELYEQLKDNGPEHWGLFSDKFLQKTGIKDGHAVQDFIAKAKADVYLFNPTPVMECLFPNVLRHGEVWHPGMTAFVQKILTKMGYTIDVATLYMGKETYCMCHYVVGNKKFWQQYISFVEAFINTVKADVEDTKFMFEQSAKYSGDAKLSFYPFIVERLLSVFLAAFAEYLIVAPYMYTFDELKAKLEQKRVSDAMIREIMALGDIKQHALVQLKHNPLSIGLLRAWSYVRNAYLTANQQLMMVE